MLLLLFDVTCEIDFILVYLFFENSDPLLLFYLVLFDFESELIKHLLANPGTSLS